MSTITDPETTAYRTPCDQETIRRVVADHMHSWPIDKPVATRLPSRQEIEEAADAIIEALHRAGFKIVRDEA
jgi:hypothetical protein